MYCVRVYVDESGDLGFGPRASQYFVLAAVVVRDDQKIRRCFKKIRQRKLKKSLRDLPEFKFNNTKGLIKDLILQCIADCDLDITYAVLRKNQVHSRLRDKQQIIYNYLTGSLISRIAYQYAIEGHIYVCIDKSTYSLERDHFDDYLTYRMFDNGAPNATSLDQLAIEHLDSRTEPCIQAADFVAGAVHQMYRENDETYYRIIEPRIAIALDFFQGRQK